MTAAFSLNCGYAQELQYWVERLNPPEDPNLCPLARSVIELRERVKEHVIFTKWDIIWGLGRVNPGATSQWLQTNPTGFRRVDPPCEQNSIFMDATPQTTSPTMSRVKLTGPISPPDRMEEENQYVLVTTASIRQLNLETTGVDLRETATASPRRGAFWNPHMADVLSGPARRMISGQGAIVKELQE